MKQVRIFSGLLGVGAICLTLGFAQQSGSGDLRVVSSFVPRGQAVPAACIREVTIFERAVAGHPLQEAWHWVLVCDEAGWRRFLALSGRPGEDDILSSTDLEARTTYLRGAKLLHPDGFRAQPDQIVAHELAHIELRDPEEPKAAQLGEKWLKERRGMKGLTP
jgi:hypothetical protein